LIPSYGVKRIAAKKISANHQIKAGIFTEVLIFPARPMMAGLTAWPDFLTTDC